VGIADVSFDLPANLDEFGEDANMVCQLIEEGVINAIRHGKAKKIKIHGFFIPGSINVVIHDDGTYVKNKKSDGLGSVLFNTFAKDWDIRPEQDGTTLRFSVEIFSNTVDK
jgi:anti-sigma regulatory factor (Ser/Thr protein kinase)